jgi:hypothetical protein
MATTAKTPSGRRTSGGGSGRSKVKQGSVVKGRRTNTDKDSDANGNTFSKMRPYDSNVLDKASDMGNANDNLIQDEDVDANSCDTDDDPHVIHSVVLSVIQQIENDTAGSDSQNRTSQNDQEILSAELSRANGSMSGSGSDEIFSLNAKTQETPKIDYVEMKVESAVKNQNDMVRNLESSKHNSKKRKSSDSHIDGSTDVLDDFDIPTREGSTGPPQKRTAFGVNDAKSVLDNK